ncbi:MAG: hypothetical protein EXQ59_05250 [Acidobacteria bacterium]|nr:hypothetical protein [Acidobacteriota bacterium]
MADPTKDFDALFQLPLGEFTAARNALAAKFRKAGRADAAAQVKGLGRPSIAVWAVNQLYWRHRKPFDELMAAGERLRTAQASQLRGKGGNMREPLDARREALSNLTGQADALLQAAAHPPSADIMRRIAGTLDALATYGGRPDAPRAGRLTDEVDSPGFEALTSLVPRKGEGKLDAAPTRVIPFRQRTPARTKKLDAAGENLERAREHKARMAAAAAALRAAERQLADARRAAVRAEAALKAAAARAKQAEQKKDALAAQLEKATATFDAARQEARRVAADAEEAAQAVEDAERALQEARRAGKSPMK